MTDLFLKQLCLLVHMDTKVLLIGHDHVLLNTRKMLLTQAGYVNVAAVSWGALLPAACQHVALAILCHSLTPDETQRATNVVTALSAQAIFLALTTPGHLQVPEHPALSVAEGPQKLPVAVRELLARLEQNIF